MILLLDFQLVRNLLSFFFEVFDTFVSRALPGDATGDKMSYKWSKETGKENSLNQPGYISSAGKNHHWEMIMAIQLD